MFYGLIIIKGTCPDRSYIKQLRIYHARHQPSLSFPRATNVGHEPSQSGSTLDGFGSRDLQVFTEAKRSIQLHIQVPNALFPLNYMIPVNDHRVLVESSVREQQSLGLYRGHFQASVTQPKLPPTPTGTTSALSAKPMMLVPAGGFMRRKSPYMTF